MRLTVRVTAICIAVAGVIDPAFARRVAAPVPVELYVPPSSDATHADALALRDELIEALEGRVRFNSGDEPRARIAIGDAALDGDSRAPLFLLPVARERELSIAGLVTPAETITGQQSEAVARVKTRGLRGEPVTLSLLEDGVRIGEKTHSPSSDEESFEARFPLAPVAAGFSRLRVVAGAAGAAEAVADGALVTRDRLLRIFTYEPRPSWPVTFIRRSLEADPLFEVSAVTRSSRGVATSSGRITSLESASGVDAIVVGAPDALSGREIDLLLEFVERRGGQVILLPDRKMPEPLRRRFGLPALAEALVEKPLDVAMAGASFRASEFLFAGNVDGLRVLATAAQGAARKPVIVAVAQGAGEIIFSGALDAWRFRGDNADATDLLWRGLVADAAAASAPPLSITVEPAVARPGGRVTVTVAVRPDELTSVDGAVQVPAVRAAVVDARGGRDMIRLWPTARAGIFKGTTTPAAIGPVTVTASTADRSADALALIGDDVVHPRTDASPALAFTAAATGGRVVSGAADLVQHLAAFEQATVERRVRPMRSPWWLLPFVAVLCVEWTLRRRAGLK